MVAVKPESKPSMNLEAAAYPELGTLMERVTWHIGHGVRDIPVLTTLCRRDYPAVCRVIDELKKQNIIYQVDGGWQMVTR